MPAPWVAGAKPFECQPATFERPVFLNSFKAVGTTSRCKTAFGAKKWRYSALVEADNGYEQYGEQSFQNPGVKIPKFKKADVGIIDFFLCQLSLTAFLQLLP